ncbi:Uncharacterized protein XB17_01184 [Leptospira santarosai]|nr:Uncharacterized protein XB17_01184 [Leptospira santarosai]
MTYNNRHKTGLQIESILSVYLAVFFFTPSNRTIDLSTSFDSTQTTKTQFACFLLLIESMIPIAVMDMIKCDPP